MRILGGELRGRQFHPPAKNWPTRPTTDISKEALYNILTNRIDFPDLAMLDLFGGTGNHSYEFASRGCIDITYVDNFYGAVKFVKKQILDFKIDDRITIYKMDVRQFVKRNTKKFDFIFAGPPYPLPWLNQIPNLVLIENDLLNNDGIFVMEHNQEHDFSDHPAFDEVRNYGQTHFSFFRNRTP